MTRALIVALFAAIAWSAALPGWAQSQAQTGPKTWSDQIDNSPTITPQAGDWVGMVRNHAMAKAAAASGSSCPALSPGTYTCSTVTVNSSGCISIVSSGTCSGGGGTLLGLYSGGSLGLYGGGSLGLY